MLYDMNDITKKQILDFYCTSLTLRVDILSSVRQNPNNKIRYMSD